MPETWTRRLRPMPENPEAVARAGEAALLEERWDDAVRLLSRACAALPTCARTQADLAFALARVGRREEAMGRFELARRLGVDDGETYLMAARVAAEAARPADDVEWWVAAALERSPTLVTDLDHPVFDRLRHRGVFREVVERAWRRSRESPPA